MINADISPPCLCCSCSYGFHQWRGGTLLFKEQLQLKILLYATVFVLPFCLCTAQQSPSHVVQSSAPSTPHLAHPSLSSFIMVYITNPHHYKIVRAVPESLSPEWKQKKRGLFMSNSLYGAVLEKLTLPRKQYNTKAITPCTPRVALCYAGRRPSTRTPTKAIKIKPYAHCKPSSLLLAKYNNIFL